MEKLTWRAFQERDTEHLKTLHAKMQAKAGMTLDAPDPRAAPIVLAMVGVTETGEVKAMVTMEAILEVAIVADDPQAIVDAASMADSIAFNARHHGFRFVRAFVKTRFARSLGAVLKRAGFQELKDFAHFYRFIGDSW